MEYLLETSQVYRPLHVTYCDQWSEIVHAKRLCEHTEQISGQFVPKSTHTQFWSTRTLVNLNLSQLVPKPTCTLVYTLLKIFKGTPDNFP